MEIRDKLRPYVRGSFLGVAIGDALGMPVETMSHEEILEATGGAGITGYSLPLQKRFGDTGKLLPGMWTDDTQLTLAVARSLVRNGGFDPEDMIASHVEALGKTAIGWGKSTRIAIQGFRDGTRKLGDPPPTGLRMGSGNGVAMKIAPLAIWHALRGFVPDYFGNKKWFELVVATLSLGHLTHSDKKASYGAALVAAEIVYALHDQSSESVGMAACIESVYVAHRVKQMLAEDSLKDDANLKLSFHALLPKVMLAAKRGADALRLAALPQITREGFHVVPSVCYSLGVARRHAFTFREAVLEAVNAGGDTDTNASMVGAIIGARVGVDGIPAEWVSGLYKADEIVTVADALLETALS